jgi:SAM-dependent methyltransferase
MESPSEYQIQDFWSFFLRHKCKRVLDAGCGTGWLGKYKPENVEVHGIDANVKKLRLAKKYEIATSGDTRNLPYKNDFFDGIFCHHVLEHLEDPENAVGEFHRVLKNRGVLIAEVPSRWDPNAYRDRSHKQFFTKENFSDLFEKSGFKVLTNHYCALEIKFIKNKFMYVSLAKIGKFLANRFPPARRAIRVTCVKRS